MTEILHRSSQIFKIKTEQKALSQIATRSRKTPRIGNRLLRRVRDYSEVKSDGSISLKVVLSALEQLEVDEIGLDKIDLEYLKSLILKFGGGPGGLDTLSASISEDPSTVEDVIEPFLLNLGFISRTNRGRIATSLTFKHLNIEEEPKQKNLI